MMENNFTNCEKREGSDSYLLANEAPHAAKSDTNAAKPDTTAPFGNGCPLYATDECRMLNMTTCKDCTVNGSSAKEMESIKNEIQLMRSLMPKEGIDKLFLGDECLFCKGEPNEKSCYALLDVGHKEPKHREKLKQALSGTKDAGSIIPLQISCCDECKKRISRLGYVKSTFATVVSGAALLILSLRAVHEPLMAVFTAFPLVIFLVCVAIGIIGGGCLQTRLKRQYEKKTHLHVMDIPQMRGLEECGWFVIYKDEPVSKLVFSAERLKQGLFTGEEPKKDE